MKAKAKIKQPLLRDFNGNPGAMFVPGQTLSIILNLDTIADHKLVGQTAVTVKTLSTARETQWQTVNIRRADRGILRTDFSSKYWRTSKPESSPC